MSVHMYEDEQVGGDAVDVQPEEVKHRLNINFCKYVGMHGCMYIHVWVGEPVREHGVSN